MGTARSAIAFSISSELQPALSMPVGQFGAERGQLLRQPPQKPVVCSAVFLLISLSIAISYLHHIICHSLSVYNNYPVSAIFWQFFSNETSCQKTDAERVIMTVIQ
jgi:hypothetical protein